MSHPRSGSGSSIVIRLMLGVALIALISFGVTAAISYWKSSRALLSSSQDAMRNLAGLEAQRVSAGLGEAYDTATTPAGRLLRDHPTVLDDQDRRHLDSRITQANPAQLRRDIDLIQRNLLELARRRGTILKAAKRNHVYLSRTKMTRAKRNESTTQPKRAS